MSGRDSGRLSILFAIPTLPPRGGGAEVHAARLGAALRRRGHDVTILTMDDAPPARIRRGYFVKVVRTLLLERRRFDLVHFFLAGRHTAFGVVAAWARRCPSVVMYGGTGTFAELEATRRGRLALALGSRLADRLIALNEDMRRSFRAWGAPDERIVILPCEVDPDLFRPGDAAAIASARARFRLPPEARVVSFVGRFVPEKEVATLVAAFARVAAADPAAVLVLAGDGPERPALDALVATLPEPGRVVMTGRLAEREVRDLLQASDVFALVSSLEGIPCALVEAMAVGLPSVVSDIPGLSETALPEVHGLAVPLRAPEPLARAMLELLSDPERRRLMGRAARQRALDLYATDVVAAAHERLYREIVAGRR